jgi:hypothetical protein
VPSIHTPKKKKKKKSIFKKVVKKHGWCPWMFQLWRLCVVFLCCCRRRVAVACTVCRRMYLLVPSFLPSFSCRRLWCGADGDRNFLFFFYKLLYIDRAQSKLLSKIHVVCIVTRHVHVKNTSWTPGCKLPKGGHTHLVKKHIFCSDQMTPSRESLTRTFLSCAPPLLAITVSPAAFSPFLPFVAVSVSGLLIVCRVRDDGTGGMEGHVSRDCTMEQKAKSCYRCGREGHIVRCVLRPLFRRSFL